MVRIKSFIPKVGSLFIGGTLSLIFPIEKLLFFFSWTYLIKLNDTLHFKTDPPSYETGIAVNAKGNALTKVYSKTDLEDLVDVPLVALKSLVNWTLSN